MQLTSVETGVFSVFAPNAVAMAEAKEIIDQLLVEEVSILFEMFMCTIPLKTS